MNKIKVEKALTRTFKKTMKKARLHPDGGMYVWFPILSPNGTALVGNDLTNYGYNARARRRLKGILPELVKRLHKTSVASGFNGCLDFSPLIIRI